MNFGVVYLMRATRPAFDNRECYKLSGSEELTLEKCEANFENGTKYICVIKCRYPFVIEVEAKKRFLKRFASPYGRKYFEGNVKEMISVLLELSDYDANMHNRSVCVDVIKTNNFYGIHFLRKYLTSDKICEEATTLNRLDVIQWIFEGEGWIGNDKTKRFTCSHNPCTYTVHDAIMRTSLEAAKNGNLEILEWVKSTKYWDSLKRNDDVRFMCTSAVENGQLKVLEWAKRNGIRLKRVLYFFAAKEGHLPVMKWLYQNGIKLTESVCELAAENGHLDILKWAVKYGCKINDFCKCLARANAHENVVDWISNYEVNCEYVSNETKVSS